MKYQVIDNNIKVKLIKELLHIRRVLTSCNTEIQKNKALQWYYTYLNKHRKEIRYYSLEDYLYHIEKHI